MLLGMMMKEVIGMTALEEVVAMIGVEIVHIVALLAQCTGRDLVLTMVVHQALYMVPMAGAEVLFVIATGGNALGLFLLVFILCHDCSRTF